MTTPNMYEIKWSPSTDKIVGHRPKMSTGSRVGSLEQDLEGFCIDETDESSGSSGSSGSSESSGASCVSPMPELTSKMRDRIPSEVYEYITTLRLADVKGCSPFAETMLRAFFLMRVLDKPVRLVSSKYTALASVSELWRSFILADTRYYTTVFFEKIDMELHHNDVRLSARDVYDIECEFKHYYCCCFSERVVFPMAELVYPDTIYVSDTGSDSE